MESLYGQVVGEVVPGSADYLTSMASTAPSAFDELEAALAAARSALDALNRMNAPAEPTARSPDSEAVDALREACDLKTCELRA